MQSLAAGQVWVAGVRVEQPKRAGLLGFHHGNTHIVGSTALRPIRETFLHLVAGLSALKMHQAPHRENGRDDRDDRDGGRGHDGHGRREDRHSQISSKLNMLQKWSMLISTFIS